MTRLKIDIESKLNAVSQLGMTVHSACEAFGLPEEMRFRIQTAVVEAASNAVRHAYDHAPDQAVTFTMEIHEGRVELEVIDSGKPMPPQQAEVLRHGSNVLDFDETDIEALPEGGLGLEIIHRSMDNVNYTSNNGINRIHMMTTAREEEETART